MTTGTSSNFDTIIKDFFDQLGLSALPQAEKEKRFVEMQEVIQGRIFLRMLENLNEEQQREFEACETDEAVDAFYKKYNINLEEIALVEASAYREEMMKDMAYVQGRLDERNASRK